MQTQGHPRRGRKLITVCPGLSGCSTESHILGAPSVPGELGRLVTNPAGTSSGDTPPQLLGPRASLSFFHKRNKPSISLKPLLFWSRLKRLNQCSEPVAESLGGLVRSAGAGPSGVGRAGACEPLTSRSDTDGPRLSLTLRSSMPQSEDSAGGGETRPHPWLSETSSVSSPQARGHQSWTCLPAPLTGEPHGKTDLSAPGRRWGQLGAAL